MSEQTKAQALWTSKDAYDEARRAIGEVMDEQHIVCHRWETDPYDSSLEIYGTTENRLVPEVVKALFDLGFWTVWTHSARERHQKGNIEWTYTQGGEKYGHGSRKVY